MTALVAGGEVHPSLKSRISQFSRIIAVDGGLSACKILGLSPDEAVGDFDSASPPSTIAYFKLPRDKDETDLEVAIAREFERGVKELFLFGAWGGRIDHSLTNALLLTRYPGKLFLETEKELVFAINQKVELNTFVGQTISLIALNGPSTGIMSEGLKWELSNRTLDAYFIGISNVALNEKVTLSFKSGSLLLVQELAPPPDLHSNQMYQ